MNLWLFLILAPMQILAVYRLTRLMTVDEFPPVLWFRDRVVGGWRPLTEKESDQLDQSIQAGKGVISWQWQEIEGERSRYVHRSRLSNAFLAKLFSCPFCLSFWISAGVVLGAWFGPQDVVVPTLTGLSAWAVGGWLAAQDWS